MHQAAVLDGFALDALAPQQDSLPPAEMDISRGQIVQALVVAPVVILIDKGFNLGLKRAWQVIVFQQDAVLHGLVPALDLALRLRVSRRAAVMLYAVLCEPLGKLTNQALHIGLHQHLQHRLGKAAKKISVSGFRQEIGQW
jgi:hypothetical protein